MPTWNPAWTYRAKAAVASTALVALGVAFEDPEPRDSDEMQREIADWPEAAPLPWAYCRTDPPWRYAGGRLTLLGRGDQGAPLKVLFKNVDSALLVLTGLISAHQAFAENRAIVHGPLDETMQANRAMAIVGEIPVPRPDARQPAQAQADLHPRRDAPQGALLREARAGTRRAARPRLRHTVRRDRWPTCLATTSFCAP